MAATPRLRDEDREKFEQLQAAFRHDQIALVSSRRISDRKPVALLAAVWKDAEGMFNMLPLAELIQGDPFDQYEEPTLGHPKDWEPKGRS